MTPRSIPGVPAEYANGDQPTHAVLAAKGTLMPFTGAINVDVLFNSHDRSTNANLRKQMRAQYRPTSMICRAQLHGGAFTSIPLARQVFEW
jgi:hypothetical protein